MIYSTVRTHTVVHFKIFLSMRVAVKCMHWYDWIEIAQISYIFSASLSYMLRKSSDCYFSNRGACTGPVFIHVVFLVLFVSWMLAQRK